MTVRLVKVTITYCSDCGYEGQTLDLAGVLMKTFGHELSAIEILPWYDGSFEVSIDGHQVHSMMREGGFPEHEVIIQAIRERLSNAG